MEQFILVLVFMIIISVGIAMKAWYDYIVQKQMVKEHLKEVAYVQEGTVVRKNSAYERMISRLLHYADDFSDIGERFNFFSESEDVNRWLIYANYPFNLTVKRFQGLKIVLMFLGLFAGLIAFVIGLPFGVLFIVVLPFVGFFYPIFWIKRKAQIRQAELSYTLPDFLDMVSVTLKAGASLDNALAEISSYFNGPIKEEFARFSHRLRLGIPREELYKELINRTDVPEFEMVIKSLIRGSQLGIPVAKTFEIQSKEIRRLRKEKVKELASKASPKVTLITTFVVMPTAFIFIGGLMLLNILSSVSEINFFNF